MEEEDVESSFPRVGFFEERTKNTKICVAHCQLRHHYKWHLRVEISDSTRENVRCEWKVRVDGEREQKEKRKILSLDFISGKWNVCESSWTQPLSRTSSFFPHLYRCSNFLLTYFSLASLKTCQKNQLARMFVDRSKLSRFEWCIIMNSISTMPLSSHPFTVLCLLAYNTRCNYLHNPAKASCIAIRNFHYSN